MELSNDEVMGHARGPCRSEGQSTERPWALETQDHAETLRVGSCLNLRIHI